MAISANQVKELREKTGAGMMDCKNALNEANGDFEKAVELLRKKGASVAAKRAERSATEGRILTAILNNGSSGIILEVNCETDFVAKSDDFVNFSDFVLRTIIAKKPANLDELNNFEYEGKKVAEELNALIGKIGEKITVTRFAVVESVNGLVVDYIHHGSKLGVTVRADNVPAAGKEEFSQLLKDIAMQVAAMRPYYVSSNEVPKDIIEKEIEIYKELSRKEGKPEQVLEKIAMGKLSKYYQENCLIEQASIKDNSKSVKDLVGELNKKYSSSAVIVQFQRFHVSDESK